MKRLTLFVALAAGLAAHPAHGPRDSAPGTLAEPTASHPSYFSAPAPGMQAHLDAFGDLIDSVGFESEDLPSG